VRFDVISLFPDLVEIHASTGILGRAREAGLLQVRAIDLREHALGRYRQVDDEVFGGGPGMVLKPDVVARAVSWAEKEESGICRRICFSPAGHPLTQEMLRELARDADALMLLCGRYEGIDQRVVEACAFEEVSLGDYVVSGGEIGAMALIEGVSRLLPGVMGNQDSAEEESFTVPLLEAPCYTRPAVWEGHSVPPVLLSGNHAAIARWRREESLRRTAANRPDLLRRALEERVISEVEAEMAVDLSAIIPR